MTAWNPDTFRIDIARDLREGTTIQAGIWVKKIE